MSLHKAYSVLRSLHRAYSMLLSLHRAYSMLISLHKLYSVLTYSIRLSLQGHTEYFRHPVTDSQYHASHRAVIRWDVHDRLRP
jgi:hypothetical protein